MSTSEEHDGIGSNQPDDIQQIQPPTPGLTPTGSQLDVNMNSSNSDSSGHLQIPETAARDGTFNYSEEKSLHHVCVD